MLLPACYCDLDRQVSMFELQFIFYFFLTFVYRRVIRKGSDILPGLIKQSHSANIVQNIFTEWRTGEVAKISMHSSLEKLPTTLSVNIFSLDLGGFKLSTIINSKYTSPARCLGQ